MGDLPCDENLQEQRDEMLALQSIYNIDQDEKLKILSEVNEAGQGRCSIMISVTVKPVSDQIQVSVAVPYEEDEEELLGAAATSIKPKEVPALTKNVKLNRSISGRKWEGSFQVKYLTPVHLYITFPPSYPSHNPPDCHIVCSWLTPLQIRALGTEMERLWQEAFFMPVIYTWVDWLENNTLEYLGITDHLTIQSCLQLEDGATIDGMTLWEEDISNTVVSLIQNNRELEDIEFCQSQHLCEVCYDEMPGTHFFRLNECHHKFCHECMMRFCELHVRDGTVEELRCPDTKCDSILPPYIVHAVLGPEAYGRWETLLLQKTLDAMSDTLYCPRCQSLVIREEEEHLQLAHCTVCFFSFCTECLMCWHQGNVCEADEDKIAIMKKKSESRLNPGEKKKYDEMIKALQEEAASNVAMKKNTRKCPHCKVPVEKTGGCNKMTCRCGKAFCWLCGKAISGYDHFRTASCVLFVVPAMRQAVPLRLPPDALLQMRAQIAINPEMASLQVQCPSCKQKSLKRNQNNHLKCWNCKTDFCFLCHVRITGNVMQHFRGPCKQHS